MLLSVVHLGSEEVKIIKGHTFAYLNPAQYDNFSSVEGTNQERKIANISAVPSETKGEIFPAIPSNSKMIFPGEHTPVRKVLLQDLKILLEMQEKLNGLIQTFEDIMSSSSNDIDYTNMIDMDI